MKGICDYTCSYKGFMEPKELDHIGGNHLIDLWCFIMGGQSRLTFSPVAIHKCSYTSFMGQLIGLNVFWMKM